MPVVRGGKDCFLQRTREGEDGERHQDPHTLFPVCAEMILQIALDYPGLPDVRTLSLDEILFFYEGTRKELQRRTK